VVLQGDANSLKWTVFRKPVQAGLAAQGLRLQDGPGAQSPPAFNRVGNALAARLASQSCTGRSVRRWPETQLLEA